ncbi:MAG: transglycosylase SLT domain-containing protein [Gemmatimonadetes bacterium]|nr:transglycosylase SLT domain-containing protein [Gemmatimonadota bacterium]
MRTGRPPPAPGTVVVAVAATVVLAYGGLRLTLGSDPSPAPTVDTRPTALPALPVIPVEFDGVSLEVYLQAWLPAGSRDEFLSSPVLRDRDFARSVHDWMGYWTGPASLWFPEFLERMAALGATVDSALADHGLPPSLRYLPLIESGYAPGVTSRASAVGLWQLMAPTARSLDLEVSPLVDERRHAERSTAAALDYLVDLNDEFESWFLTLAAYNSGPTRVRRLLRQHAPGEPRTDSLFWALREHFAPETRAFLPKLYGAMWIASNPEPYGFAQPSEDRLRFELVHVPDQTTLDVVAGAAEASYADIARLNPEFVRGITPAGREVSLKVPVGHADAFEVNYSRLAPERRVTFVEHVVRSGETLSVIAQRYGIRTAEIRAANPSVSALRLPVGARLTVPVAPEVEAER